MVLDSKKNNTPDSHSEHVEQQFVLHALWELDSKIKDPAVLAAYLQGIIGVAAMGLSVHYLYCGIDWAAIFVDYSMYLFIINGLGAAGLILALTSFFTYKWVLNIQRKRHASQILQLTKKLLHK